MAAAPFAGALALACVPNWRAGAWLNACVATIVFALALRLPGEVGAIGPWLLVDRLAVHMALLAAFVAMTAAWFSVSHVAHEVAQARLDAGRLRLYHVMFQAASGGMLLAILSNNLGITWVGIETATVASVLVAGLPRTTGAVEAAWKLFVICGVGIALALFGTVVLYLAARPALGPGMATITWSALSAVAPRSDAPMLNLAFVFLLIGYGTMAALAPLHAWMPDAHAEGPTPVSAVLGGSILNVALLVILRLRRVMAAAGGGAILPGPPIMALGLLSVLLAAFSLWPRRDAKRFFAVSTIGQSGLAAFAIGLGGPAATLAALLHMTVHTLAKAGVLQCVGRAARLKGGQTFADIGGLIGTHRALGLTLAAGIAAVAALPPFGLFASTFLILSAAVRQAPVLAIPLAIGLLAGLWAMMRALQTLCLRPPTPDRGPAPGLLGLAPVWLHLALTVWIGFAMPGPLGAWMRAMAAGR